MYLPKLCGHQLDQAIGSTIPPHSFLRDGIKNADAAKEKIKKQFGICQPEDVARGFVHLIKDCGI